MKTRTFVLNDSITAKRIKQLISKIELCKAKIINIYLCSRGGDVIMSNIFVNFTHKTDKKIHLIGVGRMASACANIFIEAKGKRFLYPHTIALLHLITYDPESRDLLNKKSYDSVIMKEIEKQNLSKMDLYTKVFDLTAKEKSILKNGGDLGIDYERLKKALPKINKLKFP